MTVVALKVFGDQDRMNIQLFLFVTGRGNPYRKCPGADEAY
jgi:hypothetical protein